MKAQPKPQGFNFLIGRPLRMGDGLLVTLVILWFLGLGYLLSIQQQRVFEYAYKPSQKQTSQPISFVPMEDRVVPTHASYSNKFNDMIGNMNAPLVTDGAYELVIPSDWYMWREPPTEYDGPYWPSGQIPPDFLFPGRDSQHILRPPAWNASYFRIPGN